MTGSVLLILRLLMTAALYTFLGLALYLLWRDLQRQAEYLTSRKVAPLTLEQPAASGETRLPRFTFVQTEVLIGRDPACDCNLDDRTVSARHARLRYHHSQWWLEDLGSTNGTFLNDEPVSGPMVVTNGDKVRFGSLVLEVKTGEG